MDLRPRHANGLNRDYDVSAFMSSILATKSPPREWPEQGLRLSRMRFLRSLISPRHANGLNRDYDHKGFDGFDMSDEPRHANGLNRDYDKAGSAYAFSSFPPRHANGLNRDYDK